MHGFMISPRRAAWRLVFRSSTALTCLFSIQTRTIKSVKCYAVYHLCVG